MTSSESTSTAGVVVLVPVILVFAGTMAVQSMDVRLGYSPRPQGAQEASAPITDDTLQLFRDGNFKDDSVSIGNLTKANKPGMTHELPSDMEDSMSSLRWNLPPGVVVVFYEDDAGKGEQHAIWGKGQANELEKWDFSDKASQWAWFYVGGASDPPEYLRQAMSSGPLGAEIGSASIGEDSIQMFKSKNFHANTATIHPVSSQPAGQLNRLPQDLPDSMTSLRWNLPPGVVVMFYQDASGLKQQAAIWGSGQIEDVDVWDFNDKVSRWAWYYVGSPATPPSDSTKPAPPSKPSKPLVQKDAIDLVARAMEQTELNIKANDLLAKKNPTGEGTFVYTPQTRFDGVERHVIWLVVDSKAYALTAPAKLITPSLPMPIDADDSLWSRTGIDKMHSERDAVTIVFEKD